MTTRRRFASAPLWAMGFAALLASLLHAGATRAEDLQPRSGRRLLFTEYGQGPNRFVELDAQGAIAWEFAPPSTAVIFQALPNGNILFGYGGKPTGVREIKSRGETVFDYPSPSTQVFGCERLANGNTLVAEQGPCRAVEIDPQGKVVHVTPLSTSHADPHLQVRNVHWRGPVFKRLRGQCRKYGIA